MWVWFKLKLTPKGDFCVVSVRAFFVNFFMHRTEQYLNGQIWWLSIPNTLSEIKICNLHPKTRRRVSPFFFIWEAPAEDYLIFGEPVGYEGTKKWYRQNRHVTLSGNGARRGLWVRELFKISHHKVTISSIPLIITVYHKTSISVLRWAKPRINHS